MSDYETDRPESARLTALANLMILDTPPEAEFDDIVQLAATLIGVESSAISLLDDQRQWFKARHNIPFSETPRDQAFCNYAVAERQIVEVADASTDARFAANPLVTTKGGIRFYAGAPLILNDGQCLGALCVISAHPRAPITALQRMALTALAGIAVKLIEARRSRQVADIASQIVEVTPDAIVCTDVNGAVIFCNRSAEAMFRSPSASMIGLPVQSLFTDSVRLQTVASGFASASSGITVEGIAIRCDRTEFPCETSVARWGEEGKSGLALLVRDSSERKTLERERAHAHAFLDTMITNLPALLCVKDIETRRYILFNRTAETILGVSAETVVGMTDQERFANGEEYEARDDQALTAEGIMPHESEFVRPDGQVVAIRTKRLVVDGPDRPRQFLMNLGEDVTELRRAEQELVRLARYDTLTGLLNRGSFDTEFERRLAMAQPLALLSIDLDRFKLVNDQFGHLLGDDVLVQVGRRLREVAPAGAVTGRIGGDEFMMLLPGTGGNARIIAEAAIRRLSEPFVMDQVTVHLGASIGSALAPIDGLQADELRMAADLALYRAKDDGRGMVRFFSADMDAAARERRALIVDLRAALAGDQITLAFQPVVAVGTGAITSFEALARWTHPTQGPISPDLFIGAAEEAGLIEALGERLLIKACEAASRWPSGVRVAVNMSPLQFQSGLLFETVANALVVSGLAPDRLQIEVTEGLVIRDVERIFFELTRLRSLGIHILMDDFGVGYSSLSYFQRFPFDKVKLDRSFVTEAATSKAAHAIILAVVQLGKALGMGVVAEGVETQQQLEAVVAAGCTHIQGYLLSRPIAAADVLALLRSFQVSQAIVRAA